MREVSALRAGVARRLLAISLLFALTGCQRTEPAASPPAGLRTDVLTAEEQAIKAKLPEKVSNSQEHAWIMDAILGKPKREIRSIGILVYDGVNDLDFTGPRYVLGQSGAKTRLIGVKPGPIKTVHGRAGGA